MKRLKLFMIVAAALVSCAPTASAQTPGPQFWRRATCEPIEPRTRLENLDQRYSTVILKGFTRVTTIELRGIRVDAVEMHQPGRSESAKGLVIALREGGDRPNDNRAFVDYEEIDPLLGAIDSLSRIDESSTKLTGFEARYQTHGDLEMVSFRQTNRGTAVTLTTGICEKATVTMSLDEFGKFKAMIQEAKARIDELR
ncbi:MAG TPA: hypothetical protein VLB68_27525 [Pyrinomonadaceae bacterium]|nr:hypothetical protein [Pyrinomonadaceae bacterium]